MARALGDAYVTEAPIWGVRELPRSESLRRIGERLGAMLAEIRERLARGAKATAAELRVFEGAAVFFLFDSFDTQLQALADARSLEIPFYDAFAQAWRQFLCGYPGAKLSRYDPAHVLGIFSQARRTFFYASTTIFGSSPAAQRLRAAIWLACFGEDMLDYESDDWKTMDEVPVLLTGETGTGKGVVAECLALSRYVRVDGKKRRFETEHAGDFQLRNLSTVPEALAEAALFGHKRGSFTGADADATGFLGACGPGGTLFLDEIGDLALSLQVKLLDTLQTRLFTPIGGIKPLKFLGRLVCATLWDLSARVRAGKFRPDLLHRINTLRIFTPTLREQLAFAPEERRRLVRAFVAKITAREAQIERRTSKVEAFIARELADYEWPGNMREIEACTRSVLLSGGFVPEKAEGGPSSKRAPSSKPRPGSMRPPSSTRAPDGGILGPAALAGELTYDEAVARYVTWVYLLKNQNQTETARQLGVNWRTVGKSIDLELLARWLKERKG